MATALILLPPVELFPDKTKLKEEQPGLEMSKSCSFCDRDCWISLKKRALLNELDDALCICFFCFDKMVKEKKDGFKEKMEAIRI